MVRNGIMYNQIQTTCRALVKVGVTWLLSFSLYVPAIIGYDVWRGHSSVEEGDCDVEFASVVWYTLLTAIIEFVVPFSLLSVFSGMLYANIYNRSKLLHNREVDSGIKQKQQQLRNRATRAYQ